MEINVVKSNYIDIHSHILPGVDDGSKHMDMTMRMLHMAYEQGVRKIFATPHYSVNMPSDYCKRVKEAYLHLQRKAANEFDDMSIYLGAELYMENGIVDALKKGNAFTMNGTSYVLCEFAFGSGYRQMYEGIRQLIQARYKPIMAHVERYKCLNGHMERIEELRQMGVLMQMNAECIVGSPINANVRHGKKLLKERVIEFVASDSHNITDRCPNIGASVEKIRKLCGEQEMENMLHENAASILVP